MLSDPSDGMLELVKAAHLSEVSCRAASVKLLERERETHSSPIEAGLTIGRRKASPDDQTREFRIALELWVQLPVADLQTVFIAQYGVPADLGELLTDEIITEYANNVAVMTLFPYVRESLGDLARRVGVDFTLPIIQRGQMTFEVPESKTSE